MIYLVETVIIVVLAVLFLYGCWTLFTLYKDFRRFVRACRSDSCPTTAKEIQGDKLQNLNAYNERIF